MMIVQLWRGNNAAATMSSDISAQCGNRGGGASKAATREMRKVGIEKERMKMIRGFVCLVGYDKYVYLIFYYNY